MFDDDDARMQSIRFDDNDYHSNEYKYASSCFLRIVPTFSFPKWINGCMQFCTLFTCTDARILFRREKANDKHSVFLYESQLQLVTTTSTSGQILIRQPKIKVSSS